MSEEQSRWVGLSDCSWMNIVNHANCYAFHDKKEAVEMAVKLTEAKLKSLNDVARPCPRCAELEQDLQTNADALAEVEQIRLGLQNCRLFAARHRNEDWALLILGFCAEAGEVGSITR